MSEWYLLEPVSDRFERLGSRQRKQAIVIKIHFSFHRGGNLIKPKDITKRKREQVSSKIVADLKNMAVYDLALPHALGKHLTRRIRGFFPGLAFSRQFHAFEVLDEIVIASM